MSLKALRTLKTCGAVAAMLLASSAVLAQGAAPPAAKPAAPAKGQAKAKAPARRKARLRR
jgi:hypothetical protein